MTPSLFPEPEPANPPLSHELATLEHKVAALVDHALALRTANESLRQELASANARNRALSERVHQARKRLDVLLARLPGGGLLPEEMEPTS
jgi:regulator of replication initiation timing